jgi:siroheme synthase-like protein
MTPLCYPIALVLEGKSCLIVGGGEIADGKLDALFRSGAHVTVVSPEARPRIGKLAAEGRLAWLARPYQESDLAGMFLVIAATDDNALNARVVTEARARGILAQAVDFIPYCDFSAAATSSSASRPTAAPRPSPAGCASGSTASFPPPTAICSICSATCATA